MKKLIGAAALCLATLVLLSGCKKEGKNSDENSYYIKGKKDGAAFTYSAKAMAMISDFSGAGISLACMAGPQTDASNFESLGVSINFFNGTSPAVGTYGEDDTSNDYAVAGVYNPNSMTIVWGAGLHYPSAKPLQIHITSKTDKVITGTFEGAFYKQDSSIPQVYDDYTLFTECEFRLPVVN